MVVWVATAAAPVETPAAPRTSAVAAERRCRSRADLTTAAALMAVDLTVVRRWRVPKAFCAVAAMREMQARLAQGLRL